MMKILRAVETTIKRFKLFKPGDRILIALSGGPDSVALLHVLSMLAHRYGLTLAAAHVNHKLRKDAEIDQRFCRELCRAYGYKFYARKIDIKKRAKRLRVGIEQAGRDYRYSYFQTLCMRYGYNRVATGHTADDSVETFLLNLVRGANLGGLGGMPPSRGNIIRPLIGLTKSDLLHFLDSNMLSYRLDKTNLGVDYDRNIVRNKVIPVLNRLNPGAAKHISKAANSIRDSYEIIQSEVEKAYQKCLMSRSKRQIILDLEKLRVYYKSLESWLFLRAYLDLTGAVHRPGSIKIERALALSRRGSVAFLDNGIVVSYHGNRLIFSRLSQPIKRIKLKKDGINELKGTGFRIKANILKNFAMDEIFDNKDESIAFLDDEKAVGLAVRALKAGDRFRPLGMKGTKKLVDYFNDKAVTHIAKRSIPLVVSEDRIAWVAGYGISDEFKVTSGTKEALRLQLFSK